MMHQLKSNDKLSDLPKIGISHKTNLVNSIIEVKKYFEDYLVIPDALKILKTLISVWISTYKEVYIRNNVKYLYN